MSVRSLLASAALLIACLACSGCYTTRTLWKPDQADGQRIVDVPAEVSTASLSTTTPVMLRAVVQATRPAGDAGLAARVDPRRLNLTGTLDTSRRQDPRLLLTCPQLTVERCQVRIASLVGAWAPPGIDQAGTVTLSGRMDAAALIRPTDERPAAFIDVPPWSARTLADTCGPCTDDTLVLITVAGRLVGLIDRHDEPPVVVGWRSAAGVWASDPAPLTAYFAAARAAGDCAGLAGIDLAVRLPRGGFALVPTALIACGVGMPSVASGACLPWTATWTFPAALAAEAPPDLPPMRELPAAVAGIGLGVPATRYAVLPTVGRVLATPVTLAVDAVCWGTVLVTAPVWFPVLSVMLTTGGIGHGY